MVENAQLCLLLLDRLPVLVLTAGRAFFLRLPERLGLWRAARVQPRHLEGGVRGAQREDFELVLGVLAQVRDHVLRRFDCGLLGEHNVAQVIRPERDSVALEHLELERERRLVHEAESAPHDEQLAAVPLDREQSRAAARRSERIQDEPVLVDDALNSESEFHRVGFVRLAVPAPRSLQITAARKERPLHRLQGKQRRRIAHTWLQPWVVQPLLQPQKVSKRLLQPGVGALHEQRIGKPVQILSGSLVSLTEAILTLRGHCQLWWRQVRIVARQLGFAEQWQLVRRRNGSRALLDRLVELPSHKHTPRLEGIDGVLAVAASTNVRLLVGEGGALEHGRPQHLHARVDMALVSLTAARHGLRQRARQRARGHLGQP